MKKELRRIEETLHQLTNPMPRSAPISHDGQTQRVGTNLKSPSFEVSPRFSKLNPDTAARSSVTIAPSAPPSQPPLTPEPTQPSLPDHPPMGSVSPLTLDQSSAPSLPKLKMPSFSTHRNGMNPALASNLLDEMQRIVAGWQRELAQVVRQIQDLYLEGPIVNGWLESHTDNPPVEDAPILRHGEVDHLIDFVETICSPDATSKATSGYRLCGLNANGQLWSSPCAAEEVPSISLAISRHQKLRQLLARKQNLETRLTQLAETLVVMHGQLKEPI